MEAKPHPRIVDMRAAMAEAMAPERPPDDESRPIDADEGADRTAGEAGKDRD